MDKLAAVEFLIYEAARERRTKSGYTKAVKALWALGLADNEVSSALYILGYANSNGVPYRWLFEKKSQK